VQLTTSPVAPPSRPANGDAPSPPAGVDILFYDGLCGLCNGVVRFLLGRDRADRFRYASLQSEFARATLAGYGEDAGQLSTVFLIQNFGLPEQRLVRRSRAALGAMRRLGGGWTLVAILLSAVPPILLDAGYRLVARGRYALFGRYDSCPIPAPQHRHLFLDSAVDSATEAGVDTGARSTGAGSVSRAADDRHGKVAPGGGPAA